MAVSVWLQQVSERRVVQLVLEHLGEQEGLLQSLSLQHTLHYLPYSQDICSWEELELVYHRADGLFPFALTDLQQLLNCCL